MTLSARLPLATMSGMGPCSSGKNSAGPNGFISWALVYVCMEPGAVRGKSSTRAAG